MARPQAPAGITNPQIKADLQLKVAQRHAEFALGASPVAQRAPAPVQIGQDRGGFSSDDWLKKLFLLSIHGTDGIHREWQRRAIGDLGRATPPGWLGGSAGDQIGWTIAELEPKRALVLKDAHRHQEARRARSAAPSSPTLARSEH
jgi:hypothetical protein